MHIRRSDFAFIWIRCSDFICITFASTAGQAFNFVFCISGVQTSPLYVSDVQTLSVSHFASTIDQTFRLRLVHIRRSDFTFIWIRCSDFICITFASIAGQTFRLRLLHIRRSDFAFIWIRCSDFICITFVSTTNQTFRLRLLHGRSDFAFIGSDVQTPSVSRLLASHFRRSDFVFYK